MLVRWTCFFLWTNKPNSKFKMAASCGAAPLCEECEDMMGSIVCYECEKDRKVYCSECSATLHQLKRRQTHRLVPLEEDFNECLFGPEQPHPELDTEESNIEEFDVQLNKVGKTLGIRIHQPGDSIFVAGFEHGDKTGQDLPIQIGDVLIQIDNVDIIGKSLEDVISLIQETPSPIRIRGVRGNIPPGRMDGMPPRKTRITIPQMNCWLRTQ